MGMSTQGPAALVGQVVGGYRLARVIGMGATGAVFLGERVSASPDLPAETAVKLLILPWQLGDEERDDFRRRFLREAETLRRLRHPHVLPVLASGEDSSTGFTYMVLPYMAGGTLATRIRAAGRLPLDVAARIVAQVAEALDYAHSQGVIHRDVKPANVLLDTAGQAYLADFSIVKLLAETSTRLTSTGNVLGTPSYMAPEQVTGREVGPAADIYGLGMVLYELVTGRVAFEATSIIDLIRQHVQDAPPPPRLARPDLPEPAEAAILKALAKEPGERFASGADFARAFTAGLRGEWAPGLRPSAAATGATARQFAPPLTVLAPRERRGGGLIGVGLAALLVLTGTLALLAKIGGPGGSIAQTPTNTPAQSSVVGNGRTPTHTLPAGTKTTQPEATATTADPNNGGGNVIPTDTPTVVTTVPTDTPTPTSTPIPPNAIVEYPLPVTFDGNSPAGITTGSDGNLWYALQGPQAIGRSDSSGGQMTKFPLPNNAGPWHLRTGPDGNIWFTTVVGNYVGKITPTGNITEFQVCSDGCWPYDLAFGADGNIWFTMFYDGLIGRLSPSGSLTTFAVPTTPSAPFPEPEGLTAGPDGNMWYTTNVTNRIGRITLQGSITEFAIPTSSSGASSITAGPDGNLWFTESSVSKIGQITTFGAITEYPGHTAKKGDFALIIQGPDHNLWFAEDVSNQIARMTPSGVLTEFPLPNSSGTLNGLAQGSDSRIWFTVYNAGTSPEWIGAINPY